MSTISVIIPAYNADKYLAEAIESALSQTRPAKEIIVVDDASTDRTVEIARSFRTVVRVVKNPSNMGVGVRRNQGVRLAQGDFMAYLDADDKWTPSHLENLGLLLDRHDSVGLVFSPVQFFGGTTGVWPKSVKAYGRPRNAFFDMLRNIPCVPSSTLIRRSIHDAVKGFDETAYFSHGQRIQAEDLDYSIRVARITDIMADSEPTALYRWHQGQASVLRDEQIVLAFVYRLRILDSLAESRTPAAEVALAQDRVLRCWEEHIEELWQGRNSRGLRMMVRFGLGKRLLARATWSYVVKAGLPQAAARRL